LAPRSLVFATAVGLFRSQGNVLAFFTEALRRWSGKGLSSSVFFHGKPLSIEFSLQEMECQVDSVSSSPIAEVQLLHGDENIVLNAV